MRPFGVSISGRPLKSVTAWRNCLMTDVAFAVDERLELFPRGLLRAGHLPRAELLLARADLHADFRQRGHRLGHGGDFLALHPGAVGELDVGVVALMQPRPVGLGHGERLVLPLGLDAEPVDAGRLNFELGEAAALAADEMLEAAVGEILPVGASGPSNAAAARECARPAG